MVDDVGTEELTMDANNAGPVEPRTEVVVVEAVVAAVDVTTDRKSDHLVHHARMRYQFTHLHQLFMDVGTLNCLNSASFPT